ncbi:MAG: hypothetical protein QM655_11205, partial [Nocardioidaceae bacterium]
MVWQVAASSKADAAAVLDESFANATLGDSAWTLLDEACLTDAPAGSTYACDRDSDPTASITSRGYGTPAAGNDGTGFLQLTDNSTYTKGGAIYNNAISADVGLAIEFTQYQYGPNRNNTDRRPADGIGFFLVDGSTSLTSTGPTGGALGYGARRDTSVDGISGGYLGVGLDTFGNFSNTAHVGGSDCTILSGETSSLYGAAGWNTLANTNAKYTNNISLRGSGSGLTGYCLLARKKLDTIGSDGSVADTFSGSTRITAGSWGSKALWAGELSSTPTQAEVLAAARKIKVIVSPVTTADPYPTVSVYIDYTATGNDYELVLSETVATAVPSAGFKFGFSASTGSSTASHLIGDLRILAGPAAEDDAVTLDQGETATFDVASLVSPGASSIASTGAYSLEDPSSSGTYGTSYAVDGEGTWTIDPDTGEVTFEPIDGFTGPVTPITYRVVDANDQADTGTLEVIYRPATGDAELAVLPGATASFTADDLATVAGSADIASYSFADGATSVTVAHGVWTINETTGLPEYTADADYTGPVDSITYYVTDANEETATGVLSIIMAPLALDETKAANPGDSVSFDPLGELVTAGSSTDLTVQLVDPVTGDAESSVTVDGQGTWTVDPDTGVVTFTPEDGFTGTPDPIDYVVTDGNELSDTGTLTVYVNTPPSAGDASVTVNPGETATLTPVVDAGSSTELVYSLVDSDAGDSTTKTVAGEGTWTIDPDTGVVTFTPEDGFTGT